MIASRNMARIFRRKASIEFTVHCLSFSYARSTSSYQVKQFRLNEFIRVSVKVGEESGAVKID